MALGGGGCHCTKGQFVQKLSLYLCAARPPFWVPIARKTDDAPLFVVRCLPYVDTGCRNNQQLHHGVELLLLGLQIRAFPISGYSNLFSDSALNALDFYMKYTTYVVHLHTYCVVYFCTRSVNCILALLHFWWWTRMPLDNEHFYSLNVFPFVSAERRGLVLWYIKGQYRFLSGTIYLMSQQGSSYVHAYSGDSSAMIELRKRDAYIIWGKGVLMI